MAPTPYPTPHPKPKPLSRIDLRAAFNRLTEAADGGNEEARQLLQMALVLGDELAENDRQMRLLMLKNPEMFPHT